MLGKKASINNTMEEIKNLNLTKISTTEKNSNQCKTNKHEICLGHFMKCLLVFIRILRKDSR